MSYEAVCCDVGRIPVAAAAAAVAALEAAWGGTPGRVAEVGDCGGRYELWAALTASGETGATG